MESVRDAFRVHPFWSFVLLTYLFSWACWLPNSAGLLAGPLSAALDALGVFGPVAAALVVTWGRGDSVREWIGQLARWRVPARWYLLALGLPALAISVASAVHVLALGAEIDLSSVPPLRDYPIYFAVVLLVGGGLEEPGWRGFGIPHLQARHGALAASLLVGLIWALWHLPLFVTVGTDQAGLPFLPYAVGVTALSVVYTWLYNSTGGSVLLPVALHTASNVSLNYYPAGGADAVLSTPGLWLLAGVQIGVALVVIGLFGRERLSRRQRQTAAGGRPA